MKKVHNKMTVNLKSSMASYNKFVDCKCHELLCYKEVNLVMLEMRTLKLELLTIKFAPRRVGP